MNIFNTPLTVLSGIGEKRNEEFKQLGINNLFDLLYFFPSRYQDRSNYCNTEDVNLGDEVCLKCFVKSPVKTVRIRRNLVISSCIIEDETGEIMALWYNQKFIDSLLAVGKEYIFFGKIEKGKSRLEIHSPLVEKVENSGQFTGKIIPIYSLNQRVPPKIFQKAVENAMEYAKELLPDFIPKEIKNLYGVMDLKTAIMAMHFPIKEEQAIKARERFVFEEFFIFQAGIAKVRINGKRKGVLFKDLNCDDFTNSLPFKITNAQRKVIEEIKNDLRTGSCMSRLIQGDVGSGKTVVGASALYLAVKNGYQGAMMVPTEILAKQHYKSFKNYFENLNIELITSSTTKKNKELIISKLENGQIDIIIGTHSLIEENVKFKNLGLVITDEQHRFGVNQRQKLINKGQNTHVLVMSATPIPRTLALILYGDLDISIIDELPPGRQKIKTYLLSNLYRDRVYTFVKNKVIEGLQAYVVCPLVEQSETLDLKDATSFAQELSERMPNVNVGLLHGKMKDVEKCEMMEQFLKHTIDVLVSTTVIEVGVDVPNAAIMIIENAERFGLSQLHQLRGRVGRGKSQSYCILFANTKNEDTIKRLKVIEKSTDGFYISEEDLKFRGPGDFFGTRQHGLPVLKTANPIRDFELLYKSKEAIEKLVTKEIKVSENESKIMKYMVEKMFYSQNNGQILN